MAMRKLLVITAGTVAAGVGQKILEQMEARSTTSTLKVHVRYLETAYLPNRYPKIRQGEWQQMSINAGYMQSIHRNKVMDAELEKMLYPGFLPETAGVGGGGIRYNGAGAVVVNRNILKNWLGTNMTELIRVGDSQTNIYMALVISSVGATGSGSLERLIDVIVDAATTVDIPLPIRCDVFIMQPGMDGVTDLGQANTLALYAEMAASRLSQDVTKQYQGRTVMVGWGSKHSLSSIEQLQEATASLVRVSNDPTNGIVAEYQEREVDNHVLREMDAHTNLPTHLSSATVVTLSLGNLEEKVIQRDAIRLVDGLVFGGSGQDNQSDILLGAFANFLSGDTPKARYNRLLESLLRGIELDSLNISLDAMRNVPSNQQAGRLTNIWQTDKNAIEENSNQIETLANTLAQNAIKSLERTRRERMSTGLSLERLRTEYYSVQQTLSRVLAEARDDTNKNTPDDVGTAKLLDNLNKATLNRQGALRNALGAVQTNIDARVRQSANPYAIAVLDELEFHCGETVNNLDVVLQKLRRERETNPEWAWDRPLKIATGHLLQMPALSSSTEDPTKGDQTKQYYDKVSIFAPRVRGRGTISISGNKSEDQLASFRKWLKDRNELDTLFKGEITLLLRLAQDYARVYVHEEVRKYSILDILEQMGGTALRDRLSEAAALAHSFVSYNEGYVGNRPEVRHVSAFYRDEEQRHYIELAMNEAFGKQGRCTLLKSEDPTEIAIFYYIDGLPMSAIRDLNGRCFNAFLRRRFAWYKQVKAQARASQNGNNSSFANGYNQKVGVPVYSGYDAEQRVRTTGVICQLYKFKEPNVDNYDPADIPELEDCMKREQQHDWGEQPDTGATTEQKV